MEDLRHASGSIQQCPVGHLQCFVCFVRLGGVAGSCPVCQRTMGNIRNGYLEGMRDRYQARFASQSAGRASPPASVQEQVLSLAQMQLAAAATRSERAAAAKQQEGKKETQMKREAEQEKRWEEEAAEEEAAEEEAARERERQRTRNEEETRRQEEEARERERERAREEARKEQEKRRQEATRERERHRAQEEAQARQKEENFFRAAAKRREEEAVKKMPKAKDRAKAARRRSEMARTWWPLIILAFATIWLLHSLQSLKRHKGDLEPALQVASCSAACGRSRACWPPTH